MKIVKMISVADLFTIINALLGFTGIICLLRGKIDFAIMFILFAILADGADGFIARRFSKKWCLGDYLDIMADTISFCVTPAALIFTLYYNDFKIFVILSCLIFVVSGVLRLARFCYLTESKIFTGLPAPGAALPILILSAMRIHPIIVTIFIILLSFLMISDIKYPKISGKNAYASGGIILLLILSILFSWYTEIIFIIALIFAFFYVFCSPVIWVKINKH